MTVGMARSPQEGAAEEWKLIRDGSSGMLSDTEGAVEWTFVSSQSTVVSTEKGVKYTPSTREKESTEE